MMIMTDSVAMGSAMVYPIAALLVAIVVIGLLTLLFVVLMVLLVRRICRRDDPAGAAPRTDSSVNTGAMGGYTPVGGSPLWPAALVYQVPEPQPARRSSKRFSRRGQRRHLSSRSASTLQHGTGRGQR